MCLILHYQFIIMKFFERHNVLFTFIAVAITIKVVWVAWSCWDHGSFSKEKKEIFQRKDYLVDKVVVTPQRLIDEMPEEIGSQFQGEWALYSCSMLTEALSNMTKIYPDYGYEAKYIIDSLIQIVKSPEIRQYDIDRWGDDPLQTLDGQKSHLSYLSHLAWMIGNYRKISDDDKYDKLHYDLCKTLNRRIRQSKIFNIPTYPNEPIYVPDMMVAIVALSDYAELNNGKYKSTVDEWLKRAKSEWIDKPTGLLVSFISEDGEIYDILKGSYTALNCFYLTKLDPDFAKDQYKKLKAKFRQDFIISGIKEYHDHFCLLGLDVDAGPIILNLSPTGTAFALGCATYFSDSSFRTKLLKTAEIAGHTIEKEEKRHYLLADFALVGEAITLAMRTNHNRVL